MKLLLDQGTPRSSAALLRQAGFEAVHTGEIGLAEAPDEEILRRASLEDRVGSLWTRIFTPCWRYMISLGRRSFGANMTFSWTNPFQRFSVLFPHSQFQLFSSAVKPACSK
jgi:hypothetical protein